MNMIEKVTDALRAAVASGDKSVEDFAREHRFRRKFGPTPSSE